jgi:hypothetical protein
LIVRALSRLVGGTLLGFLLVVAAPAVARAASPVGTQDISASGASSAPTGTKPESKLWFNDGSWWGSLWSSSAAAYHIYKFNPTTGAWGDTGTVLDTRSNSRADTLWDGTNLWVASHVIASDSKHNSANKPAKLWKFSYAGGQYTLAAGFPVNINGATGSSSETLVIDRAGDGTLWATWTQAQAVYVAHSDTSGQSWTSGQLGLAGSTSLNSDDISSLISFGGNKIGLMWSNQATSVMSFAVHTDGGSWATPEVAASGNKIADDHINLKTDPATGIVYAAVKTSLNDFSSPKPSDPLLRLMVRSAGGSWSAYTLATVADGSTRPIIELDPANAKIYAFMTAPDTSGPIYEKVSNLGSISFPTGKGTVFMQDSGNHLNNATSTKQNVSSAPGGLLLVEASDDSTHVYWHNTVATRTTNVAPVANADTYATPENTRLTCRRRASWRTIRTPTARP